MEAVAAAEEVAEVVVEVEVEVEGARAMLRPRS